MKDLILRTACSFALLGLFAFPGVALADESAKSAATDTHFAIEAAQGGMAEVQLGNLAKDHASSDAVKQFGQKMVDDHSQANAHLKSIAAQRGITLPTDIGAKNQAEVERLSKLNGAAFDHAYLQLMVKDHKKDVADFHKEANAGTDSSLKKFATDTLPTLEGHLRMAKETAGKGGANSADRMRSTEHGAREKK